MLCRIKTIVVWRCNRRNLDRCLILSHRPQKVKVRTQALCYSTGESRPRSTNHLVFAERGDIYMHEADPIE